MILLNATDSIQVILAGAITSAQAPLYEAHVDVATDGSTYAPGASNTQTNSATAVTVVSAPAAGQVRQVKSLNLYNADTASMTATLRLNDGTTTRILRKVALQIGESIEYVDGRGWTVFDVNGAPKTGSVSTSVNVQSIVSAATVTPAFGNDLVDITAQAAGLTIANPGGTAVPGQPMAFRIRDNGTARAIGFGTKYRAVGGPLPTTTVAGKLMVFGAIYNATDDKVDVIMPAAKEA